jgi:deuterolysin
MKFLTGVSVFTTVVSAHNVIAPRAESPFSVTIKLKDNSHVKASVTNKGPEDIKILKTGSVLDSTAIEKTDIYQGGRL